MNPHVVVVGVAGAGKTTVARAIATQFEFAFADGDDFHDAASIEKMRAGIALDDVDRIPWLERIGAWLAEHPAGVVSCSALRRSYRERLRAATPDLFCVHLTLGREVAKQRMAARADHFMPVSLLESQFKALEPLGPGENGISVDATHDLADIIRAVTRTG